MTIKTILLIEDDLFIGEMYSRSLSREGYQVNLIKDGEEGLQEALKGTYDLILLDVMLPEKRGTEILSRHCVAAKTKYRTHALWC
jgi:DNA-binding response OmpR family regulator